MNIQQLKAQRNKIVAEQIQLCEEKLAWRKLKRIEQMPMVKAYVTAHKALSEAYYSDAKNKLSWKKYMVAEEGLIKAFGRYAKQYREALHKWAVLRGDIV